MAQTSIQRAESRMMRAGLRYAAACDHATRAYAALGLRGAALEAIEARRDSAKLVVDAAYAALVRAREADPQAAAEAAAEAEILSHVLRSGADDNRTSV